MARPHLHLGRHISGRHISARLESLPNKTQRLPTVFPAQAGSLRFRGVPQRKRLDPRLRGEDGGKAWDHDGRIQTGSNRHVLDQQRFAELAHDRNLHHRLEHGKSPQPVSRLNRLTGALHLQAPIFLGLFNLKPLEMAFNRQGAIESV